MTSPEFPAVEPFHPSVNLIKRIHEQAVDTLPRRGARFWLLLSLAYLCIVRGVIYDVLPNRVVDLPIGLRSLGDGWVAFYGIAWIVAGVLLVAFAFNRRWSPPLFAVAAVPSFVWSIAYLATAIQMRNASWNGFLLYHAISLTVFWAQMVPPARGWYRGVKR